MFIKYGKCADRGRCIITMGSTDTLRKALRNLDIKCDAWLAVRFWDCYDASDEGGICIGAPVSWFIIK